MHALVPSVDIFFHVPRPSIRHIQTAHFTFRARQCNVECLEAARKKCKSELAFRKYTHPSQKTDDAEEARELAWDAESREELTLKCADGTVCLSMHVLYGLHVWETRGQSRSVQCEVSSASWKCPPRTHASASTGSSEMSCNFDECSRTRTARRRRRRIGWRHRRERAGGRF